VWFNRDGTVRTHKFAYLLIFLSIWSQFDDVLLATFPTVPSAPLTDDDDDEYLSVGREQGRKWASARQKPVLVGLKLNTPDVFGLSASNDSPPGPESGSLGLSSLYVFMSLQL
jgi:hypothetical protein